MNVYRKKTAVALISASTEERPAPATPICGSPQCPKINEKSKKMLTTAIISVV